MRFQISEVMLYVETRVLNATGVESAGNISLVFVCCKNYGKMLVDSVDLVDERFCCEKRNTRR